MTSKERLYATIRGEPRDRVPVTPIFMAWAAHYTGHSYRDYYLNGDVLVEAQLAVARAFRTDQVSAISDPWREAAGYGMEFDYPEEGVGVPRDYLIKAADDVTRLHPIDIERAPRMRQRIESVARMAVDVGQTHSVLGWVEGPMAAYVDLRRMEPAMLDLIEQPDLFHQAARIITENAIMFAKAQIEAGADMIGVGDAAASLIGPEMYIEHVLPWQRQLFSGIHEAGATVRLHICGDIRHLTRHMATSGAEIIDVDWMVPLAEAREAVGPEITLCGNFDPVSVLLRSTKEEVATAAHRCITNGGERFALMPGCEVPPDTPEENIRAFCPCKGSLVLDALRLP
jgi:uroporphyrinogen decarboxylase